MFVNEIILAYLSSLKVSFKGMELPKINSGLVAMNYPLERALLKKKNNKQQQTTKHTQLNSALVNYFLRQCHFLLGKKLFITMWKV